MLTKQEISKVRLSIRSLIEKSINKSSITGRFGALIADLENQGTKNLISGILDNSKKTVGQFRGELLAIENLEQALYEQRTRSFQFYNEKLDYSEEIAIDKSNYVFKDPELAIAHAYVDTAPAARDEFMFRDDADLSFKAYSVEERDSDSVLLFQPYYVVKLFHHHLDEHSENTFLSSAITDMLTHENPEYIFNSTSRSLQEVSSN